MIKKVITGSKGGGGKPHNPVEMEDNLISINKIRVLLAVSDGEVDPDFDMKMLLLNDVPVMNDDGTYNYEGITAEFRPGTQTQDYIQGFTDSASEVTMNRVIERDTPYSINVTNKSLSAIRIKMYMPRGVKVENNGDKNGVRVEYKVELAVDGAAFTEYFTDVIDGKTMSGYDRSRRINLPAFNSQVIVRVSRVTPDSDDSNLIDEIQLKSYAEVIDAKFRYPLTGLLFVEFDSKMFPTQIPNISLRKKWKVINVPSNYNPITRDYNGSWDGTFKKAWSNNPAWVLYDIITNQRYGLDQRELGINVDKWALYEAGQYCDQMVPDGKGGTEPRYLCDVVIQSQIEAFKLVRDICSIFRGMSFWNGESLSVVIDKPRDPSYIFTNENVVGGNFSYSFASEKSMYTTCNVQFDDHENLYQQDVEPVFDTDAARRFGNNPTSITAIGCTRRSEANRRGRWILRTNLRSTTVNFATGLEGMIPQIGDVVAIADNFWSSNLTLNLSGRVMEVSGLQIFTAFRVDARAGDFIVVNKPDGKPVKRTISSVSPDGKTIEINVGFGFDVAPNTIFAIDRTDVALQQYVVTDIKKGDGDEEFVFSITAVEYDPNKYDAIDYGVNVDDRPTSVVDPDKLPSPKNVAVESFSRVVQGLSVETMVISWDKVDYAAFYEVQWRKNNGNWINVPRTQTNETFVEGIYAGEYSVRVRAISSSENASVWSEVVTVGLTGKVGEPGAPINFTASDDVVFGIRLKWGMPEDSGDTAYIEVQQSPNNSVENASLLTLVPYPQHEYFHTPLEAGKMIFYRIRAIDKIGNVSSWTNLIPGMASTDVESIIGEIKVDIENSPGYQWLKENATDAIARIQNTAESAIENALANDKDVRIQRVKNGKFTAQIKESLQLIANETEARVTQVSQMEADFDGRINAQNTELRQVIATETEALSQEIEDLRAAVGDDIQAQLTQVQQAIANETEARTTADTALSARIGNNEAALNQKLDSWANVDSVGAMYGVKLGLTYNGQQYSAGIAMSLVASGVGGVKSQLLFEADRFAIYNGANNQIRYPFIVEGGQVILSSAVIKDGFITNAMIGGYIQSNNYVWNQSGWHLGKDGTFLNFGSTPGEGSMKQDNQTISVRDQNGVLRVQIGRITGVW
ncbi:putative ATP-dependent helicase [Citrobacter phage IME-JL8]|uniref:Tail fiber protein n=2 Tax=Sertoctavirus SRT8 TaxID=2560453 RepID=A0A2D1GP39_9CAUD|nr:tail protein [Escherichia phage SRT8]ATN93787.1 tail fiber protein [Escherichia phage SRT8]QIG61995.1 putative ATP-dependent helicase [Citrobacter phage IME-JL8]